MRQGAAKGSGGVRQIAAYIAQPDQFLAVKRASVSRRNSDDVGKMAVAFFEQAQALCASIQVDQMDRRGFVHTNSRSAKMRHTTEFIGAWTGAAPPAMK